VKFLCDQCKAKYQISDEKVAGKTVRMKCRKCGHFIEVRAEVTESSVASFLPDDALEQDDGAYGQARPAGARQPPQRPTALAASFTAPRPAGPKPAPSALAGAFRSSVQREEEISAPFDMAEVSPVDDWYVAINGVPVGPVRVAEIRRKASLGAVTEDSLVWQEGLDEWRPLRTFPELVAIIRAPTTTGRSSLTPPPADARSTGAAPRTSTRPAGTAGSPRAASARPASGSNAPLHRSNVVAITSRLATAERLEESLPDALPVVSPAARPVVETHPASVADPFAASPASAQAATASADAGTGSRKGAPWMAIAMTAAAVAFGMTAAIAVFMRPQPTPAPVVVQMPAPIPGPVNAPAPATQPSSDLAPAASATASPGKPSVAWAGGAKSAPTPAAAGGRSLDLHSLTQGTTIAPTDDPGSESAPKAAGQCFSEGQVQQVIGLHQIALRRACWERSSTPKPTVNVAVSMTIGPDGSAQNVSASGDETSVAKCIENDVRGWHFPALGCSQKTGFSFKFVRQ
jgi:predicted Zn finger-like uncharacterized protein